MDLAVTRIGSSSCPLRDIIAEIRFLASTYLSYMTIVTYLKWDFWKNLGICPNLEMGDGVLFKLVYFICTEKALSNGTTK